MTIESQQNKKSWIGDGSTTVYAYPYPFVTTSDIEVYFDGVLKIGGYTVERKADYSRGADITFSEAPQSNVQIVIKRNIPITQEVSYPENGEFPAKSHEKALDKLTMITIDNDKESVRVNPAALETFNAVLPYTDPGKAIIFNKEGTGFTSSEFNADDITDMTREYMERAETAANNAEVSEGNAKQSEINAKASEDFARDTVVGFDTHALEKQNEFDINAATLTARYDNNDLAKTNAFNQNAQDMTDGFNQNVMLKIDDFDAHAMEKEIAFDDNAAAKQVLVDASAAAAKNSETIALSAETNARESAEFARKAANGTIGEYPNGSAKYWAEQAGAIVGEGVIQDGVISLTTTYSSTKLEGLFTIFENHDSLLYSADVLADKINEKTTVPLSALTVIDIDGRPSHKSPGATVYDDFGTAGYIDTVTDTEAIITTVLSRGSVQIVETLNIEKNGFGQYYVALTASQIRDDIIRGKIVQLSFDDIITNTGEQIYLFETFTKDNYAVFRRNVITEDKVERINIKVDYLGIVQFDPVKYNGLDYKNITNCITEIPQNIKLELKDNKITVKAGTKFTFTDGRVTTVGSDKVFPNSVPAIIKDTIMVWDTDYNGIGLYIQGGNATSGATPPAKIPDTKDYIWFDTNENKMKITHDTQASWYEIPLPIGTCDIEPNKYISINQVFNGFGYIGSTVFALPGVKGLIPNGRNADGSLKNKYSTTNTVILYTENIDRKSKKLVLTIRDNNTLKPHIAFFEQPQKPNSSYSLWLNTGNNKLYISDSAGDVWTEVTDQYLFGYYYSDTTKITSFSTKQPFRALDYNDKSTIGSWGLPSSHRIDLALGASQTFYTAPANGYFQLFKEGNSPTQIIFIWNSVSGLSMQSTRGDGAGAAVFLPVRKGDRIKIDYTLTGKSSFGFIYTEGEI